MTIEGRNWIQKNCPYGWEDLNSCAECPVVKPKCKNKPTDEQILKGWDMSELSEGG